MKKNNKRIVMIAVAILVAAGVGFTEDLADGRAERILHVATFKVPDLSQRLAKAISKVLAKEPGVVSGKSDFQKESFSVTFDAGKTDPQGVLKMISGVTPNAQLEKVEQTQKQGRELDCGNCPRRNNCTKSR